MKKNIFVLFLIFIACTKELSMPPEISPSADEGGTGSDEPSESENPLTAPTGDGESASSLLDPNTDSDSPDPQSAQAGEVAPVSEPDRPVYLGVHMTEVVTDPQRDWNDTAGGNGIPFDSTPGSGTIGSTDEWIEIENDNPQAVDVSGYSLSMVDGTNETELLGAPKGTLIFSEAGSAEDFGAGEILVIGNPPGDLKNTVTLTMTGSNGELVDEVVVENGDAHSLSDESFRFTSSGDWAMGEATFLKDNY